MPAGCVLLLATSPRVPAGLLSWRAWEALRTGPVFTAAAASPQLPALRAAGIDVQVLDAEADPVRALLSAVGAGGTVVWLGADEDLRQALSAHVEVEVLQGSYDPPGARLLDVVAVMDRLRSPGGCPWDAQQTHSSLRPYLLEEAYEAYQALEDGDLSALREELGDVLLQVAFHARLAQEDDPPWSIDDVAGDLVDKLVRRHPHVFAGAPADDLEGAWERQKAAEKGRTSVTDGVPLGQPALSLAAKLQKRAGRLGAPVPAYDGLGGELWELVRRCREQGTDPEVELRTVARRFRDELARAERQGGDLRALSEPEWVQRWS